MSRWRRLAAVVAAAVTLVVASGAAAPAHAASDAPVTVGWWTSAQLAGSPLNVAPVVPEGGFQIANGSNGPVSIAAARFAVPDGASAQLTLPLTAPSTPEIATVAACPIVQAWQTVRAAPLRDAPAWDCGIATAGGAYDPSSRTMTWSFADAIVRDGYVDVMLLPVRGAMPFTLTSNPPGADAVTLHPARNGPTPPATSTPEPPAGDPVPDAFPSPTRTTVIRRAASTQSRAPTEDNARSLPAALPEAAAALPVAVPSARHGGRLPGLIPLFLAVGLALALWRGVPSLPWEDAPSGDVRGVGRFARPRTEAAPRI